MSQFLLARMATAYAIGGILAAIRNLYRFADLGEITFEEAFARTVLWPLIVVAALFKGIYRTVYGGFR
jgi:hypothetical protein